MHADTFEEKVGINEEDKIGDLETFKKIMKELRVLARCKPAHKYMITDGLK